MSCTAIEVKNDYYDVTALVTSQHIVASYHFLFVTSLFALFFLRQKAMRAWGQIQYVCIYQGSIDEYQNAGVDPGGGDGGDASPPPAKDKVGKGAKASQ
jgi:hypothetical protein